VVSVKTLVLGTILDDRFNGRRIVVDLHLPVWVHVFTGGGERRKDLTILKASTSPRAVCILPGK
jgi:hypothetical protein